MAAKWGLFLSVAILSWAAAAIQPPAWPSMYYVSGTLSIPYFNITEPLAANFDAANNRQRFDYYNELDTYIYLNGQGVGFEIVPRITEKVCFTLNTTGSDLVNVLPDLSTYKYQGLARANGWITELWQLQTNNYGKIGTYSMYVYRDSSNASVVRPIRFLMEGVNTIFNAHPDIYIMDYHAFEPGFNMPGAYNVPSMCKQSQVVPQRTSSARANLKYLSMLFNGAARYPPTGKSAEIERLFADHASKYGKSYSPKEYLARIDIFERNLRFIEQHNAKNLGFKLAMNQFGDWSDEEFKQIMLPKSLRRTRSAPVGNDNDDQQSSPTVSLPEQVDWVSKGAVTMVKDQGACGSCWTFGTTGTIEGAYFVKTGKLISLSEQQIVDCAWGYQWSGAGGNLGCDGGYAAGALQWVIDNGGIALEGSYPYIMQDAWCLSSEKDSGVALKGYVNVTATEAALQQAVASMPVAVAIDASHPEFRFYSSGVYYQPDCGNTVNDLDHEVLAVGYGTYQGSDYWLVKNSWSTHWGNNGYIMMSRNRNNNCGIASQANYPLL